MRVSVMLILNVLPLCQFRHILNKIKLNELNNRALILGFKWQYQP